MQKFNTSQSAKNITNDGVLYPKEQEHWKRWGGKKCKIHRTGKWEAKRCLLNQCGH